MIDTLYNITTERSERTSGSHRNIKGGYSHDVVCLNDVSRLDSRSKVNQESLIAEVITRYVHIMIFYVAYPRDCGTALRFPGGTLMTRCGEGGHKTLFFSNSLQFGHTWRARAPAPLFHGHVSLIHSFFISLYINMCRPSLFELEVATTLTINYDSIQHSAFTADSHL